MKKLKKSPVMLEAAQISKLERLAKAEGVSCEEINRRAIRAYDPIIDSKEFENLMDELKKSSAELNQALEETHQSMQATLAYFAQKRRNEKRIKDSNFQQYS